MSFLEYNVRAAPTGFRKVLFVNWPLVLLVSAVAAIGFLMLYSVADGNADRWAAPQMRRFAFGVAGMFVVAFLPIWFWRNLAPVAYLGALLMLVAVAAFGEEGKGAQRWLDIGFVTLQPSELMKIALVMMLAAYYDLLDVNRVSRPVWVVVPALLILIPTALVLRQPDLGTALMLMAGGAAVMFVAGVSWWYFGTVIALIAALVIAAFETRGTDWQLLEDYQYRRIDIFMEPESDPLGSGYNITQAKIALGSGGWTGKGYMQGTQTRLNFVPEKHTDFIFTTFAEELGFVGAVSLLMLYALTTGFAVLSAFGNRDRFASLMTFGIATTFFLFYSVNMSMVMGLVPVVGVPLPLVSYGGTSMMILLLAFGLVQSAHIHRPR